MSKQTAIQLLRESIDSEVKLGTKMVVNWDMYLEMEREQIEDAINECRHNYKHSDNYYNETYKK